ncbi:MAG TPA: biotin-dependent carboxyltransferase family protein [Burkholderiaceae bacterium]|nr:biotin-dependent carboxyltransferase family protein [Burkholderiaceae bacterium]
MTIRVLRAGLLATVQDRGRAGFQHLAIVPGGAMDTVSHRVANALVGNFGELADAATLEVALAGPELEFESDALIALHGARFDSQLDGAPMPGSRPVRVQAGARLRIGHAVEGAFGYLAIAGGIAVPQVLGSRSTYLPAGFGGLGGRAIARGAVLPLAADAAQLAEARYSRVGRTGRRAQRGSIETVRWSAPLFTLPATDPLIVRVVDGVHAELFSTESRESFLRERWRVAAESNRMGYRLQGAKLALMAPREIVSQGVAFGTVQVPADGQPIALMADRQTTGGYPRIAEVVCADVPRLAQAAPGHATLRFKRVGLEAADAARGDLERRVVDLIERLRWEYGNEAH